MDRKAAIIEAIRTSETPVSASALARKLHVSRQIIVVFERVENALRKKGLLYEEAKRSSDQG